MLPGAAVVLQVSAGSPKAASATRIDRRSRSHHAAGQPEREVLTRRARDQRGCRPRVDRRWPGDAPVAVAPARSVGGRRCDHGDVGAASAGTDVRRYPAREDQAAAESQAEERRLRSALITEPEKIGELDEGKTSGFVKDRRPASCRATDFRARFFDKFKDPAFGAESSALKRIEVIAWDGYTNSRKAPLTHPAGRGYADPSYDLSDEWRAARDRRFAPRRSSRKIRPRDHACW